MSEIICALFGHAWMWHHARPVDWGRCIRCRAFSMRWVD